LIGGALFVFGLYLSELKTAKVQLFFCEMGQIRYFSAKKPALLQLFWPNGHFRTPKLYFCRNRTQKVKDHTCPIGTNRARFSYALARIFCKRKVHTGTETVAPLGKSSNYGIMFIKSKKVKVNRTGSRCALSATTIIRYATHRT